MDAVRIVFLGLILVAIVGVGIYEWRRMRKSLGRLAELEMARKRLTENEMERRNAMTGPEWEARVARAGGMRVPGSQLADTSNKEEGE